MQDEDLVLPENHELHNQVLTFPLQILKLRNQSKKFTLVDVVASIPLLELSYLRLS